MDIPITGYGVWQAQVTGRYLARTGSFDAVYHSPFLRTAQTAQNIRGELQYDIPLRHDDCLGEKLFGILHGRTTGEVQQDFPEEYESRKLIGKYWYKLPGGENYPDVGMRVHSFLDKLVRDYAGKSVLVVTHHVPCIMFRALFEHLPEKEVLALGDVHNCGIAEYECDSSLGSNGRMVLREWNKVVYDPALYPAPHSLSHRSACRT